MVNIMLYLAGVALLFYILKGVCDAIATVSKECERRERH